jgi:hypothetical protein
LFRLINCTLSNNCRFIRSRNFRKFYFEFPGKLLGFLPEESLADDLLDRMREAGRKFVVFS